MKTAKNKAIGVLVLGMHRSGTSALTRMLNILGCALPRDLLGSNESNPEGHWESQRAIEINDTLLTALGRSWDDIRELPADWLQRPETEIARQQIRAFLDREFSKKKLWVLKEPRLCRLAPLWLEMIDETGAEARIIVPVRHPAEVAYSLTRRDGIGGGRSYLMWLQHLLEAEKATASRPRVLVHFHELLADWRMQAKRIAADTGIVWPGGLNQNGARIDAFLKPELRHSDAQSGEDPGTKAPIPEPVAKLYRELTEAGGEENAWNTIRGFAGQFADAAALYSPGIDDLAQRAARSEQHVAAANSLLLSGLTDPSHWRQNAELITQLREAAQQAFDKLDQATPLLAELVRQVEAQRGEIGPAVHSQQQQIAQLRQENHAAYQQLGQTGPLLEDLTRQIETQRSEIDTIAVRWAKSPVVQEQVRLIAQVLDESRATLLKLDQADPLVQELVRQIEAQRDEITPVVREQLQQIAQLRDESRHVLEKLAQVGPLTVELIRQVEAQRGELGPAVQQQSQQIAQLREENRDAFSRLGEASPLLQELTRQLEVQRSEIGAVTTRWIKSPIVQEQLRLIARLCEESQATLLKLDQAGPLLQELSQGVEANRGAMGSFAQEHQQQIARLREDSQTALGKLDQTVPLIQKLSWQFEAQKEAIGLLAYDQLQQMARLREESLSAFAKIDQAGPKVAALIEQVEAQRSEIGAITSRWLKSPMVQEQFRLVGQVHEETQAAFGKLDQASRLVLELTAQIQAQRGEMNALTTRWAESQIAFEVTTSRAQALAVENEGLRKDAQWNAIQLSDFEATLAEIRVNLAASEAVASRVGDLVVDNAGLRKDAQWDAIQLNDLRAKIAEMQVTLNAEVTARGHFASEFAKSEDLVRGLNDRVSGLESYNSELRSHVSGLESANSGLRVQMAQMVASADEIARKLLARESTIEDMLASHSWRLTAPLRGTRRLLTSPRATMMPVLGSSMRSLYRTLPISWSMRLRLKSMLFGAFKPFVRNTNAYRRMLAAQQEAREAQARMLARQEDRWYFAPTADNAPIPASPAIIETVAADARTEGSATVPVTEGRVAETSVDVYVPMSPEPVGLAELRAKLIAFYLPQFHPIPENDEWWGRGFTEWTNVSKALPQFEGHDQPHLPGELGYYDLRVPEVMQRQVELARHYGVHGFCFHYYWFDGRRILEKPLNQFLANASLDFPFCVCWANENWTRRWDGADHDILLGQNHTPESDMRFIVDLESTLRDPRYIRIDGRPLLVVYRPSLLPDCMATVTRWREYCRSAGIGELFLVMVQFDAEDPRPLGFDAAVEFPPHKLARDLPHINNTLPGLKEDFEGYVVDYRAVVERARNWPQGDFDLIRGVFPGWDNEARKPKRGYLFAHHSPDRYRDWLKFAIDYSRAHPARGESLVFVNAWNEWAEGAYLEPNRRQGYAYLQATRDALTSGEGGAPSPQEAAIEGDALSAATAPVNANASASGKPRVIVTAHDAHPHGAQYLSLNITRELIALGCDVTMVVLGDGVLMAEYEAMTRVFKLDPNDPSARAELARRLYSEGFSAAIANTTVSGLFAADLRQAGCKVVSLIHELPGVIEGFGLIAHAQAIASQVDCVVFAADAVRHGFESFAPLQPHQAIIRTQGLYKRNSQRALIDQSAARARLRSRLGLPDSAQVVLGVGYADHRKGIDLFVEAGEQVMRTRPNAHFVWLGHFDLGLEPSIRARVALSPSAGNFHFPGRHPDTDDFYAGSDVLALTSREDPFPSVVMESLDVGVPIVAFRGAGGFETLLERAGGRLVEHSNVNAFATAVDAWLGNETERKKVGAAGKALVDAEFSFRAYIFDLLSYAGIDLPRISVVVPNYNYAHLLRDRLQSIVDQTVAPYEIIVLDDASTDSSPAVISELLSQYDLRVTINASNSGSVFLQWLKGVELARGDYVWIAEADDLSDRDFLAETVTGFRDPGVTMSYCQSRQIDGDGTLLAENYLDYTNGVSESHWLGNYVADGIQEIRSFLSVKNTIPNVSAVVFKREELFRVLDESIDDVVEFRVAGDWMVYLKMLETGKIAFSSQSLNSHRRHSSSVTTGTNQLSHLLEVLAVQRWINRRFGLDEPLVKKCRDYAQQLYEYFGLPKQRFARADLDPVVASMMVYSTDTMRET